MLGDRLQKLRKERKLTQEDIAEKLGIPRSTYSNYESGKREPDIQTLNLLADFLEVSTDYMTGRTNERTRILQPHSRKMIDLLDANVSDEEIYKAFRETFLVDGIPMNKDEALMFIDFLRAQRSRTKKEHDHSDSTDSVSTP